MVLAIGTPRRHPESGIFYFRKRVPERLRAAVGRAEIRFSLHTRDPQLARLRNLSAILKLEKEWSGDVARLDPDGGLAAWIECKGSASTKGAGSAEDRARPHRPEAEAAPSPPAVDLGEGFAAYANEAGLAPSTVKRWRGVIERWATDTGLTDALLIRREHVVAWKDALLASGMSNITVRDVYVAALKATLQYLKDQSKIAENPAAGVKVRVPKAVHEREKGFELEEAIKILSAAMTPPSTKISTEMAAARRWIPWCCAYTGARVNEISVITGNDIVVRGNVVLLRIRAETNKTRMYRLVPLHSHLVEQGFLDYARTRGGRPLFYDPARSRGADPAHPHHKKVGERIAEWVRGLGIDGRVAPNHAWRHRFTSVARSVGIPEEIRHSIQGHASASVAGRYGDTWPEVAAREIEKLPRYLA